MNNGSDVVYTYVYTLCEHSCGQVIDELQHIGATHNIGETLYRWIFGGCWWIAVWNRWIYKISLKYYFKVVCQVVRLKDESKAFYVKKKGVFAIYE